MGGTPGEMAIRSVGSKILGKGEGHLQVVSLLFPEFA